MSEVLIDQKVKDLLGSMSLDEKISQLTSARADYIRDKKGKFSNKLAMKYMKHGIGQLTRTFGSFGPEHMDAYKISARVNNEAQRFLLTKTRLKIPAMVHEECLAGPLGYGSSVFPQAIGLGCTFDPDTIEKMTSIIKRQIRGMGGHQGLAPVLDVQRDARWGRTEETFSEDHYLVAAMGAAYIMGLQGKDLRSGVIATVKHFAGHGWSEGGRNLAPAHLTPREFHEQFLFPFEVAVRFAETYSLMNAYHEVDGIPCASSRELLTEILRERWGFKGIIVSDYMAIPMLHTHHKALGSLKEAAVAALEAGLDIELPERYCYGKPLKQAFKEGLISIETINLSVSRMLKVKYLLGLFDNPFVNEKKSAKNFDTPWDRKFARELASKTFVLLKNDGVLPLDMKKIKKLAVVGPNADTTRCLFGDYHITAHWNAPKDSIRMVSILEGIKNKCGKKVQVLYAQGCKHNVTTAVGPETPANMFEGGKDMDRSGLAQAAVVARQADAVIACIGDYSGIFFKGLSGEGCDRENIRLMGAQEDLLKALVDTGKPVICVLTNGRPIGSLYLRDKVNAVLECWYPGEEGGNAVADTIFGDYNPGGKLAHTFPKDAGQIPINYNRKSSSFGDYISMDMKPLFPFGHGLSYTKFEYSGLAITPRSVQTSGVVKISFTLKNTGKVAGDEVVQLYLTDEASSLARPNMELKGFQRIHLKAGQKKKVTFELALEQMAFLDRNMELVVEPGYFKVMVGSSSADIRLKGRVNAVGKIKFVPERTVFFSKVTVS